MIMYLRATLAEGAVLPARSTQGSACYDLCSLETGVIPARGRKLFDTGVSVEFPPECVLQILSRSGLSLKNGVQVGAGVVDSDYRSSLKVLLYNHSDIPYKVNEGDRIAQMALVRIATPDIEVVHELSQTARGERGFGSSGK